MFCGTFLNQIRKKGLSIRKNIIEDNKNPYYWKELKNDIEIIDLNFLEFHTDAVKCSITGGDELPTTKKYRDNFDKNSRISNDLNLSPPRTGKGNLVEIYKIFFINNSYALCQ